MSITSYESNGVTLYKVYVNLRSKKDPAIRVQKQESGINSENEAKKLERQFTEETFRELIAKESAEISWGKLVDSWEKALISGDAIERKVGSTTVEDYIQALHTYTKAWWSRPANEINRGDIRRLYYEVDALGKSRAVRDKLRSAINGMYRWAIENRKLKGVCESPALGLSFKSERNADQEKRPEILTYSQIRKLLEAARECGHDWYPIWAFALLTGMRTGELRALSWNEVDLENGMLHVHRSHNKRKGGIGPTKGRYWRDVPINDDLRSLLMELRAKPSAGGFVLPRFHDWDKGEQARILRDFCESAGVPSVRFHTLRACFATQLLSKKVSIPTIMKIGGWKSLKTMQRYIRLAGIEIAGATDELQLIPPRKSTDNVVGLFSE